MLAQVEPGYVRSRLPASAPEQGEPFSAVLKRRRGDPPAGDDALAVAAVLRVLRHLELRARDPRGAPRRDAQPERDPLAHVAGLDRAGGCRPRLGGGAARACRPAGTATSRTPRRRRRSSRWPPPASSLRTGAVVVASEHAHSSVEKAVKTLGLELRKAPVDDDVPAAAGRARPRRRVRGRRHGRHDVDGVGRSGAGDRGRVRARGRVAPRRRRVRRVGHGLPGATLGVRGRRPRRLARRQRAQVDARARRLLADLEPSSGGAARRVLARARVPADDGGGRAASPSTGRARPALPLAEALGGAALLRARRAAAADPRARAAGGVVRRLGACGAWLGDLRRRGTSRSCASAGMARTRRTRRCSSASTRAARRSSRTRSSTDGTCCGSRSGRSGRLRMTCVWTWDVLRREAAAL